MSDKIKLLMFGPRISFGSAGGIAIVTEIILQSPYLQERFDIENVDLREVTVPTAAWFRALDRLVYRPLVRRDASCPVLLDMQVYHARRAIRDFQPDVVYAPFVQGYNYWLMTRITEQAQAAKAAVVADYCRDDFMRWYKDLSQKEKAAVARTLGKPEMLLVRNRHAYNVFRSLSSDVSMQIAFNPVDTEYFKPALEKTLAASRDSEAINIMFSGLYDSQNKGAFIILDAISQIRDEVPDTRFFFAGKDSQGFADVIASKSPRVQSAITLTGHLDRNQVRNLLKGTDIFLMPSYSEAFGNALLEAMSCGIACVATKVGAMPEILANGECGVLVDPGDAEQLSAAVIRLCADPDLRRRYGQKARQRVESQYTARQFELAFESYILSPIK